MRDGFASIQLAISGVEEAQQVVVDTSWHAPAVSRFLTLQHTHFFKVRRSEYAPNGDCLRAGNGPQQRSVGNQPAVCCARTSMQVRLDNLERAAIG